MDNNFIKNYSSDFDGNATNVLHFKNDKNYIVLRLLDKTKIETTFYDFFKNEKILKIEELNDNVTYEFGNELNNEFIYIKFCFKKIFSSISEIEYFEKSTNIIIISKHYYTSYLITDYINLDPLKKLAEMLIINEQELKLFNDIIYILSLDSVNIIKNVDIVKNITKIDIKPLMIIDNIICYKNIFGMKYDDFYEDNDFTFIDAESFNKKIFENSLEEEYYLQICRNKLYKHVIKTIGLSSQTINELYAVIYSDNKYLVTKIWFSENNRYFVIHKGIYIMLNRFDKEQEKIINKIDNKMSLLNELQDKTSYRIEYKK